MVILSTPIVMKETIISWIHHTLVKKVKAWTTPPNGLSHGLWTLKIKFTLDLVLKLPVSLPPPESFILPYVYEYRVKIKTTPASGMDLETEEDSRKDIVYRPTTHIPPWSLFPDD